VAIFGIPDRSQKVTWKFLLSLAILVPGMFAVEHWAPRARKVVLLCLVGIPVAVFVLFLAYALIFRGLHPASRIATLLRAKKIDEACVLAASLLEKTPDDLIVQFNSVAAYVAAGNLERARQILGTIKKERLEGFLLKEHARWEARLNPAKPA